MEVRPGYKQTEVGVIPEEWKVVSLSRTARRITRGASPRPIDSPLWFDEESGVGWVRISDVTRSHRYLEETAQRLSDAGIRNSRFVRSGGLIMSICATVGRPIETRIDACVHDGFVVFEQPQINQSFLYHVLVELEQTWSRRGQTGSQMNLNTGLINRRLVAIPRTEAEQHAIAEALSDVDALLGGLDRLIAKKRDLKQAAMQQLLTGQTRLPGFHGEWEVKRLGDVAEIVMGQSPSSAYYNTRGNGLPLIQGNTDISNRKTVPRVFTTEVTKRARAGDILMSVRAPVGEVSHVTFDACLGRGVCAIRFPNNFLYHYLVFLEPTWAKHSKGSTFDSVNSNDVKAVEIEFPMDVDEQAVIASVLSDMDAELAALEARRDKTRDLKQAMMQELLTGKTRLVAVGGAHA